jgi:hypothetical protein
VLLPVSFARLLSAATFGQLSSSRVSFKERVPLVRVLLGLFGFLGASLKSLPRTGIPCRSFTLSFNFSEKGATAAEGRPEWRPEKGPRTIGQVPGEDQRHPPRAAPGSRNLPWDTRRIPANPTRPQASATPWACGWDGGLACARDVGGGIRLASGTSGTAKPPSVCGWCVVGRRRSDNGTVGRRLRRVSSTPRRSGPDESKGEPGAGRHLVRILPAWNPLCPRVRGHAAKPPFRACCATGQAATNLPATAAGRRPHIVAMRAVRPCGA